MATGDRHQSLRRLAWFVALWCAGVASVAAVSLIVRWALRP